MLSHINISFLKLIDHPAPNSGSITVNGTVDGKDIIKGVKKVVKEGGRVVKKVKKKIKKIFG